MGAEPVNFDVGVKIVPNECLDAVAGEAVRRGCAVYVVPRAEGVGRHEFFRAVDRVIRLVPPIVGGRSWDAFADSLWEGITLLEHERIVIIWPDSSAVGDERDLALAILDDVARAVGDGKRVSVFVSTGNA
ncbi:barstar family protein [Allokutzneria albata]|uniref:Barstar (Barnase inhibitor) n=1 Tax=Allokutzneria albata TaxID=211114 RepID=A0A1G9V691_ALLAB|nr:barstar family protein [Allokutzneria albata]SDM67613.1 Barstar (barnase inhibitor) [Allokutzneria albata]